MTTTIAFAFLVLAVIVQVVFLLTRKKTADPFSHYIVFAASLLLLATIIVRSVQIRFVAVTNTFESLVFFAAAIGLVLFAYRLVAKEKTVQFIQFGIVQTSPGVTEADDIQCDRSRKLQFLRGINQSRQVMGLIDVLLDQPPVLASAIFLYRYPSFERPESP
ncbi:hypothetical protein LCGC14_3147700 [marine sediment metagenome]|uniref:Uncharacterized protein n=1 Tax=marine sediment metagenome TaxID=412755 RepID=A0A0F8Y1V3_9ZZZZ